MGKESEYFTHKDASEAIRNFRRMCESQTWSPRYDIVIRALNLMETRIYEYGPWYLGNDKKETS